VGGSSGGEGCIVSSAASIMGIASDIGGSTRMPAFFNGVYGHKPSPHLIPNELKYPPSIGYQGDLVGTGPISRYVKAGSQHVLSNLNR
jgi:fatty acid amide hydrolase 2